MKRREFIAGLGSAVAWPLVARAQQPAMLLMGYLGARSLDTDAHLLAALQQGLRETGYVIGENVAVEFRWADGQYDRLLSQAFELVARQVAVIVATGAGDAARAAKAATRTIPIVFATGGDPVTAGLVASLNRPSGNATGVTTLATALLTKQLEMVRDLMPAAGSIAVLHNPSNLNAESNARQLNIAAATLGRKLIFAKASTDRELETAFANMPKERASALFVSTDAFFTGRRIPIVALAERYAIPAVYTTREFADVGGLISYGSSRIDAYHHAGVYVGRILKGEKPADLPVIQPTKFELVINLKTAKALGLIIPETLLATADEVIQ